MEKRNLRLLILDDSPNKAESLAVIFRNAGYATRLQRITSIEDAEKAFGQMWDLLIAAPRSKNLDPKLLLETMRSKKLDIPFIQMLEEDSMRDDLLVLSYLTRGAQDVLSVDAESAHLLLVAKRELSNLGKRRQLVRTEKLLAESERRCHLLLDSSMDAIAYIHEGMHIYINQSYVDLFGYTDKLEMEGLPIIDLVYADDPNDLKELFKHRVESSLTCEGVRRDGSKFPINISTSPASYDSEDCMQVIIREETALSTETGLLEERLREISSQDVVTGLYNRGYLPNLINKAIAKVQATQVPHTLVYIQFDSFDGIQSQVGIAGVDVLLAGFAELLKKHFDNGEELARFSDDVFVVLVSKKTPDELILGLESLREEINQHLFDVNDFSIQVTVSIGVVAIDSEISSSQEVLDRAHRCVVSLHAGNSIKVYDPKEALAAAASRGDLMATLQQTLQNESLTLLYQPVVSLHGKTFEFYEVRLRMLGSDGKELPLVDLLNVAATTGMIEQIDRWVIVNSLKKVAKKRAAGSSSRVFVQISGDTLKNEGLLDWLKKLFAATKLPPECLIIEFTEADASAHLKQAQVLVNGLKEMGCQTVLTDFGKQPNSLMTLTHLPVNYVKIAPSFVQALRKQDGIDALTELLTQLKQSKNKTIVPFVETASILSILWQAGADYIQGYYLQRPMPTMSYDFSSGQ